ncbi:MAG: 2OG-Fe(II) oxygenase family protein [Myxococcota bacterium]
MLDDAPTLHPRFRDPAVLGALRSRWAETRRLRIDDALAPGLADALAAAALAHRFAFFEKHVSEVHCLFWRQTHVYPRPGEGSSFGPIEEARRLFEVDLPALASAITGQALHGLGDDALVIDCYLRGSYLDVHTDQGADRLVAYVVGLTRDRWPADAGGHLEFLWPDEATVIDRVAPGFGTLDLFAIYPLVRPHRIPILTAPVTRLSINGWLAGELDPRDDARDEPRDEPREGNQA